MVKSERFDYNGAAKVIKERGLLDEIDEVVAEVTPPKFSKMERAITVFKSLLSVPIYLIGLHEN